jgi:hypothetical protein
MALTCKQGSFAANTVTGDQVINTVGFQPKAIIFYWTKQTATGFAAGENIGVGLSSGTNVSANVAASTWSQDNVGENSGRRFLANTACVLILNDGGTIDAQGSISAVDASGFTINWSNAPGQATLIYYIALGGADITNARAGTITGNNTVGTVSTTQPSFQPDFVLFVTADTTGNRVYSTITQTDSSGTTSVGSQQGTNACIKSIDTSGTASLEADFVSFDATGFTLDQKVANGNAILYLAIAGGRSTIGTETQLTSFGTKLTTTNIKPTGLFLFSVGATGTTFDSSTKKLSIGAASSSSQYGSIWGSSTDNVGTSDANSYNDASSIITFNTNTSQQDSTATVSSFDGEGFTLSWSAFGQPLRIFNYVVFGDHAEYSRAASDSSEVSDTLSRAPAYKRASSDASDISDSVSRRPLFERATSDASEISDTLSRSIISVRSTSDSLDISDLLARTYLPSRSASDTFSLDDLLSRSISFARDAGDSIDISESALASLIKILALSDTLDISDLLSRGVSISRSSSDAISISDSEDETASYLRATQDETEFNEIIFVVRPPMSRSISDSISLSDSIAKTYAAKRLLFDEIELADSLVKSVARSKNISDVINILDDVSIFGGTTVIITDTIDITDQSVSRKVVVKRNIADTVPLSDQATVGLLSVNDISGFFKSSDKGMLTSRSNAVKYKIKVKGRTGSKTRLT